jgi:hypothetical protein
MARIYNPEKYGDLYQPRAQSRAFQPEQAVNREQKIREEGQQDVEDIKTLARADARQATIDNGILAAQHGIAQAKAKADASMINGILSLSQTALKGAQMIQDQQKVAEAEKLKQQQEDMMLASLGLDGGEITVTDGEFEAETDARTQVNAEASGINSVAAEYDANGDVMSRDVAHQLRQSAAYKSLQGIDGNVYSARGAHSLYLQEALKSLPDTAKPKTAAEAQNMIRRLNAQFLRQTGVAGNRALVAKVLAPTMLQNTQNMVSQIVAGGIKFDQQENLSQVNSEIGRVMNSGASAEEVWRQAADRYAYGNVGFSGHSRQSNDAAFKEVVNRAVAAGDVNFLEQLRGTPKGPGLPTLGQEYGYEIDNAVRKARERAIGDYNLGRNESAMASRQILDDYYANPTVENRIRAHEELMSQGTPEAAAQAAKLSAGGLRYDPIAAADFEKRIVTGQNPPSNDELQTALQQGLINDSEYKKLAKDPAQLEREKKVRTATTDARSKLDQMIIGNVAKNSQLHQVNTSDLNGSERAELGARQIRFRHEVNGAVNRVLKTNPDIANDPLALNDLVFEEAQKLLAKPEYQMTGDVKNGWGFAAEPTSTVAQNNPKFYVSSQGRNDYRRYNATQVINQAGVSPASINPSEDLIMSKDQLAVDVKAILDGKEPGVRLRQWAKTLGVSPKALLDAQLEQYKLPTLDGFRQQSQPLTEGAGGVIRDIPNEAAGFKHLKSMGFPAPGAAYIASAISHESTWHGLREWGEVAGDGTSRNGGLISWAAWANDSARLGRIERHFGMNIAQIPESKQLEYMQLEMKRSYPQQYRVFMDPNASAADLRWAVKRYWGFDPRYTGNRWVDAERLLRRNS